MMDTIFLIEGQWVTGFDAPLQEPLPRRRATSPLFTECMWLNGELVPAEDVTIRSHSGFFEEIRCYPTERGPAIFRLEAHLRRFLHTASTLGAGDLRYDLVDLRRAVHVTVHVNNLSACAVRLILYVDRQSSEQYPTIAVVTGGWQPASNGVRFMSSMLQSEQAQQGPARQELQDQAARKAKARDAAIEAGYDEALLLNSAGDVVACTAENLFLVCDGVVYATPAAGATGDVARHTALILLRDMGYLVAGEPLRREHLLAADEAFLCGASREITPVLQIDARTLNDRQPGPLTRELRGLYAGTTQGRGRRSRGWLEYVMMEPLF